jgi:hypothetical protein
VGGLMQRSPFGMVETQARNDVGMIMEMSQVDLKLVSVIQIKSVLDVYQRECVTGVHNESDI